MSSQQVVGDLIYQLKVDKGKVLADLELVAKGVKNLAKNLDNMAKMTNQLTASMQKSMKANAKATGSLVNEIKKASKATSDFNNEAKKSGGAEGGGGLLDKLGEFLKLSGKTTGALQSMGGTVGNIASKATSLTSTFKNLIPILGAAGAELLSFVSANPIIIGIVAVVGLAIAAFYGLKAAISAASLAFTAFVTGTVSLVSNSISAYSDLQTAQISYNALLGGNIEMTNELIGGIQKLALLSPSFSIGEGLDIGKKMMAMGTPPEELVHSMKMLGDVAAATGAPLDRIALVFGQIRAAGKIMGNDWMQLKDAGIPIFELIGDAIGMSADEVMRMKEEGESMDFTMVEEAFERATGAGGKFEDMMAKIGLQTLPGVMDLMTDFSTLIYSVIGEAIGESLMSGLKRVAAAIYIFSESLIENKDAIVKWLSVMLEPVNNVLASFSDGIIGMIAWLQTFGGEIATTVGYILEILINQLGTALAGFFSWLADTFLSFNTSVYNLSQNIRISLLEIMKSLNNLRIAWQIGILAIEAISALGADGIVTVFFRLQAGVSNIFADIVEGIGGILADGMTQAGSILASAFNKMLSVAADFGSKILKAIFPDNAGISYIIDGVETALNFVVTKGVIAPQTVAWAETIENTAKGIADNYRKGAEELKNAGTWTNDLIENGADRMNQIKELSEINQDIDQQINDIKAEDTTAADNDFLNNLAKLKGQIKGLLEGSGLELPSSTKGDFGSDESDGSGSDKAASEGEKIADMLEKSLDKVLDKIAGFFDKASDSVENFYDWYNETFGIGTSSSDLMTSVDNAFDALNGTIKTSEQKFSDYKTTLKDVSDNTSALDDDTKKVDEAYQSFEDSIGDVEDALKDFDDSVKPIQQEYEDIVDAQGKYNDKIDELTGGRSPLTKAQAAIGDFLGAMTQGNLSTKELYEIWDDSFSEISDDLEELTKDHEEMYGKIDDGTQTVIEQYKAAEDALEDWKDTTDDLVGDAVDIMMDARKEINDLTQDLLNTDDYEEQQKILQKIREEEQTINSGSKLESIPGFTDALGRAEDWSKLNPIDKLIAEFEFKEQISLDEVAAETKRRKEKLDALQTEIDEAVSIYEGEKERIEQIQTEISDTMQTELDRRETATRDSINRIKAMYDALAASTKRAFGGSGFAEGGYTGDGNPGEVAGQVHKGEYVIPSHMVSANASLVAALENQRIGGGKTYNQTINNYNSVSDGADAVLLSNNLAWKLRT